MSAVPKCEKCQKESKILFHAEFVGMGVLYLCPRCRLDEHVAHAIGLIVQDLYYSARDIGPN